MYIFPYTTTYLINIQSGFLTADNATTDVISPILTDVVNLVDEALSSVKLLVGQPVDVILKSVDGTVTVTLVEVAQLLAGVLTVCIV